MELSAIYLLNMDLMLWMNILDWLLPYRREVAEKFSQLGDYRFEIICQKWLYEWTSSVRLGKLCIDSFSDTKMARLRNAVRNPQTLPAIQWKHEVPFADVEMPDNIHDFEHIQISFVDPAVLRFLHRMQPLFNNIGYLSVSCSYPKKLEETGKALGRLLSLFDEVEAIELDNSKVPMLRLFRQFHVQLFGAKLLRINLLAYSHGNATFDYKAYAEFFLLWLNTRRPSDGEPRMLEIKNLAAFYQMVNDIKKNFLHATSAACFFVRLGFWRPVGLFPPPNFDESISANPNTGEQLIVREDEAGEFVLIGRCASTENAEDWLNEMEQKADTIVGQKNRHISVDHPQLGVFP